MRLAALFCIFLSACAVESRSTSGPFGMGAALERCFTVPVEERSLPEWFAMFGPVLACR